MSYSEQYEFCIGIVGLLKSEYFQLTPAETYTKVMAYLWNKDVMASNFRALFTLQFNQWAKKGFQKNPHQLWPLTIDEANKMSEEEEQNMYEENERLIRDFVKNIGYKYGITMEKAGLKN